MYATLAPQAAWPRAGDRRRARQHYGSLCVASKCGQLYGLDPDHYSRSPRTQPPTAVAYRCLASSLLRSALLEPGPDRGCETGRGEILRPIAEKSQRHRTGSSLIGPLVGLRLSGTCADASREHPEAHPDHHDDTRIETTPIVHNQVRGPGYYQQNGRRDAERADDGETLRNAAWRRWLPRGNSHTKDVHVAELGFDDRFTLLVEAEHIARDNRKLDRLLKQGHLRIGRATPKRTSAAHESTRSQQPQYSDTRSPIFPRACASARCPGSSVC